jgi:hypothetical protein
VQGISCSPRLINTTKPDRNDRALCFAPRLGTLSGYNHPFVMHRKTLVLIIVAQLAIDIGVVAADLVYAFCQSIVFVGGFGFGNCDGDAINQEDNICSIGRWLNVALGPLVGDVEFVVFGMFEVNSPDVALSVLFSNENGLFALKPGEGIAVALNGSWQERQAPDDFCCPFYVDDARIELKELGFQNTGQV